MNPDFTDISRSDLKLIAFDLDDTLAPSKSSLPRQMADALQRLLLKFEVAVISGGQITQFRTQLLNYINPAENSKTLHLLPTCGTQYYRLESDGSLKTVYIEELDLETRLYAAQTIEQLARQLGMWQRQTWGTIIEDRGTQITFSALGQDAPLEMKRKWDPDGTKKNTLAAALKEKLPHLEVRSGGSTSVDITAKGIDKAYGMRSLLEATGMRTNEVLFIGDRLDEAGNDYPVISTGIPVQAVSDWEDSLEVIETLLQ